MEFTRQSTPDEIVKEMDRRGEVIVALEAKIAALVEALKALLDHSDDMVSCAANVRKARAALALAGEAP